jgi:dTDP-L-rhamnose 4-epimerase
MGKQILITGGAGFIGSHLCDQLLEKGHQIRVLDNLNEQVHGPGGKRPAYLHGDVELRKGDVLNVQDVQKALEHVDVVYHLAAKVGVGQSMYEIADYTRTNNQGTAILLEALIENPVEKLVVASSMSIYGEGMYRNNRNQIVPGHSRSMEDLKKGIWELFDENRERLEPMPTNEDKTPSLSSVYALSKFDQERLCLMIGQSYNLPVVALRFFNVFGTRQALSNPYTGVLAIFASRYLNGKKPLIFEDGRQRRDFVHVKDVTRACWLAAENDRANGKVFNIGSGRSFTINEIASYLSEGMGLTGIDPEITGKYRSGDIRHCFADIRQAREILGYKPEIDIKDGLSELAGWLQGQIAHDHVDTASMELEKRGLAI